MSNEIESLKTYFKSKHLHVSEEFLKACLEWVQSQYETNSINELCNKVYEQYLSVDLRELQIRVLPQDISKQKKMILEGNYAVQALCFKDISKSSYSQLKTIRNMYKLTRSNVEKENEPPGKRTLYLNLTDGVEYINAFEYETVTCLSLYMKPGIKLLLVGPLTVRNGEILLKNNNIKVLGGEIEDILVSNSVENVLARELNLPENPNAGILNPEVLQENTQTQDDINFISKGYQVSNIQQGNKEEKRPNSKPSTSENNVRTNHFNEDEDLLLAEMVIEDFEEPIENLQLNNLDSQRNNQEHQTDDYEEYFQNQIDDQGEYVDHDQPNHKKNLQSRHKKNPQATRKENLQQNCRENQQNSNKKINDQNLNEFDFEEGFSNFEFQDEPMDDSLTKDIAIFPIIVPSEPFIYIKQLLDEKESLLNKTFCVKAQFWKVLEKLAFDNTKGWTLKCVITDGTGIINANFLNEVLEEIIGMTREEALVLKQKWKNKESGAAEKLGQMINKCKDKLVTLNCFTYLKFMDQTATVIRLKPVEHSHMNILSNRLDILKNK